MLFRKKRKKAKKLPKSKTKKSNEDFRQWQIWIEQMYLVKTAEELLTK